MGQAADEERDHHAPASSWAWAVCWLMFASTTLSYMDRQAIALVGPQIRRHFGVDFESFGWILAAFGLAYAVFQIPAGFVVDRFDVRRVYAGAVGIWSLAAMAAAFSPSLGMLIALRALLGVGESFNWPCALRMTREVLPARDRSLGNGIFNSGAAIGAVLTPLTVPFLARAFDWRAAFFLIGSLGFVWVVVWLPATARKGSFAPESGAKISSRLCPRARIALLALACLSLTIIITGAIWPSAHRVGMQRIRPDGPIFLRSQSVADGASLKRNDTVAIVDAGGEPFRIKSTREGKLTRLRARPNEPLRIGSELYELDDSLGPVPMSLGWVEPAQRVHFEGWLVTAGQTVAEGQPLARVGWGRGAKGDVLAPFAGKVDAQLIEHSLGAALAAETPLLTLKVAGYGSRGWGLPALWWGAATLMLGLLIVGRLLPANELGTGWLSGLATIVRLRRFWVLVFVSCTVNLSWHFLVNWLPTYLQTDRKMVYLAGGLAAALPFLAADVGNLAGGSLSRSIGRRGIKPHAARLWVMFGGTILIACGAQLGLVPPQPSWHPVALLLLCLMALGAAAFMANYFAFCQEVSPRQTGLVVGYLGGLGNLVAAGFNPVAGHIKDTSGDFSLVFLVAGLAPALGLALLARLWEPSASKDITSPLMENA